MRAKRRKSATRANRPALSNSGTGPIATPGPRGDNMAHDFRLSGALMCRVASAHWPRHGVTHAKVPRRGSGKSAIAGLPNRSTRRQRPPDQLADSDAGLEQEFAAAAEGIAAEYRCRLAGLRGLRRHQRGAAAQAIRDWHAAALQALRRDYDAKRAAARQRRARRVPVLRPPFMPRRRSFYPQRRP